MDLAARVRVVLRDRDNREGTMQWFVPSSNSIPSILSTVIAVQIPLILAVSDASFGKITVEYVDKYLFPETPGPTSNIKRRALLLFENPAEYLAGITIYSPKSSIFETTGPYAGIRIVPGEVTGLARAMDSITMKTLQGVIYGSAFVGGALAE